MTENKRFTFKRINEEHISANIYDNGTFIASIGIGEELIVEVLNSLNDENEQLKQVLCNILLEVKRDITNTSCTGEVKAFINPNSYNLISDVLRKYGGLNG